MTYTEKAKLFAEGRDIARVFYQATDGRDSPLRPAPASIVKLARLLDLRQCYVRKCLDAYCWAQA